MTFHNQPMVNTMMPFTIQANAKPSVMCFGEALWDLLPDGPAPGGAPMNVALRLRQLGAEVALLSRVGRDELGQRLLDYLHSQGLDTCHVQIDEQQSTGTVQVDLSNPAEARYHIVQPSAWDFIAADEASAGRLKSCSAIVFGSLATRSNQSRETLLGLLNSPALKVFDVNLRPPFVDRDTIELLLRRCDWAKLNEHELAVIAGWCGIVGGVEEQIRRLAAHYRLHGVCVTEGGDGATLFLKGEFFTHPGFKVQVVDTVGSGDSFLATWLYFMLAGANPADALRRGCAMGAAVAASQGANPSIGRIQLEMLLQKTAVAA